METLTTVGLAALALYAGWETCVQPHSPNAPRSFLRRVTSHGWIVAFLTLVLAALSASTAVSSARAADQREKSAEIRAEIARAETKSIGDRLARASKEADDLRLLLMREAAEDTQLRSAYQALHRYMARHAQVEASLAGVRRHALAAERAARTSDAGATKKHLERLREAVKETCTLHGHAAGKQRRDPELAAARRAAESGELDAVRHYARDLWLRCTVTALSGIGAKFLTESE